VVSSHLNTHRSRSEVKGVCVATMKPSAHPQILHISLRAMAGSNECQQVVLSINAQVTHTRAHTPRSVLAEVRQITTR
jgi:hypothetical protein